jgi:hypothetical protein
VIAGFLSLGCDTTLPNRTTLVVEGLRFVPLDLDVWATANFLYYTNIMCSLDKTIYDLGVLFV